VRQKTISDRLFWGQTPSDHHREEVSYGIAVFPILADVVKVKKGSGSTAHWSIDFIRLSGWLRRCFTLLITPLDIDRIGQNREDSNNFCVYEGDVFPGEALSEESPAPVMLLVEPAGAIRKRDRKRSHQVAATGRRGILRRIRPDSLLRPPARPSSARF